MLIQDSRGKQCVKYLLSKGANPNLADEYTNVNDMVKKYFSQFIDNELGNLITREDEFSDRLPTSTISTFKGFICLHYAVLLDNLSIIQVLIEHHADPLLANEEGHLPAVYAGSSSKECKDLILEYEKRHKHEVSKLIGSPPDYVGYGDGGQLTDSLAKCPTAVVLFDEIDKAHPEILTIMLQLFDEGRLTDGKSKTVDGKQAVYVLTSNLASDEIAEYHKTSDKQKK
ncbi:unnamed protein product [Didymodactylos carnosus]|uniref:ATPase AAA-type core domain-containing protein n=1 Tax=Didymodactylos carnosus TaxID=1234261 RepID=A0A8S2DGG3_9BILA|nr:unnamed protein product [Didymodactylos carnosus]CAF3727901.1 unnamed protein product [Didymodactylos carnosus]